MSCAAGLDNDLIGAARRSIQRYARGGVDPRPPGELACGGSRCAARFRLGNLAPVRPQDESGLPENLSAYRHG